MSYSDDLPADFLETARALEHNRPSLTDIELADIKLRAAGPAPTRTARRSRGFARSRLAITAMLTAGVLASGGGAALGVSALSTDLTASSAQYGTPPPTGAVAGTSGPGGGVAGETASGGSGPSEVLGAPAGNGSAPSSGTGGNSGVAGASTAGTAAIAQAPRQLAASSADELPFTGYVAIPMLLLGLALLTVGLVLRRSTHRSEI